MYAGQIVEQAASVAGLLLGLVGASRFERP